jgi:DNA-binding SARP family transcriptional activator
MMLIEEHSQERFWLLRRVNFLERLNQLIEEDNYDEEAATLAKSYRKVENPSDLQDRLHEIYGKKLP